MVVFYFLRWYQSRESEFEFTFVPSVLVQEESLSVGPDAEGAELFRRPVANRRAPGAAVEPENERRRGRAPSGGLLEPIEQCPAGLPVHGDVPRILGEVHGRLARQEGDAVGLLIGECRTGGRLQEA